MSLGKLVYQALSKCDNLQMNERMSSVTILFPKDDTWMKLSWITMLGCAIEVELVNDNASWYTTGINAGSIWGYWAWKIKRLVKEPYRVAKRRRKIEEETAKALAKTTIVARLKDYLNK